MENKVSITDPTGGKNVSMMGGTYRVLVSGRETNGTYATIDMLIPPNSGPNPHSHAEIQEAFYVLEGEIEVTSDDGAYTAKKGAYINIPTGGIVHQFKNKSDSLAHILCIVMPAGMEDMFVELGTPVEIGQFLPPPEMTPETIKKFGEVGERYGQKFFPPDYFTKGK